MALLGSMVAVMVLLFSAIIFLHRRQHRANKETFLGFYGKPAWLTVFRRYIPYIPQSSQVGEARTSMTHSKVSSSATTCKSSCAHTLGRALGPVIAAFSRGVVSTNHVTPLWSVADCGQTGPMLTTPLTLKASEGMPHPLSAPLSPPLCLVPQDTYGAKYRAVGVSASAAAPHDALMLPEYAEANDAQYEGSLSQGGCSAPEAVAVPPPCRQLTSPVSAQAPPAASRTTLRCGTRTCSARSSLRPTSAARSTAPSTARSQRVATAAVGAAAPRRRPTGRTPPRL